MTRHPLRPLAAVTTAAVGLALAGCGSSGDDTGATAATGASATEASAATSAAVATTGGADTAASATRAESTSATATTAAPAATVLEATVTGGEVTATEDRFEVALGSDVVIRVTTDVAEPVHLHGYDIEVEAAPGAPAEIAFTADIPGVFEVELEDSGTLLFEVEVK